MNPNDGRDKPFEGQIIDQYNHPFFQARQSRSGEITSQLYFFTASQFSIAAYHMLWFVYWASPLS